MSVVAATPLFHSSSGFWYVAGPYSGDEEARAKEHRRLTAKLLIAGVVCYSPIVHCHEMAREHRLPGDAAFWAWYNFAMLDAAGKVILLELPGWQTSKGTTAELLRALSRGYLVWGWDGEEGWRTFCAPDRVCPPNPDLPPQPPEPFHAS